MNIVTENSNLNWNIRFPKGILLSEKLNAKQKFIALLLYEDAHGRVKTSVTIDEIVERTGYKRSTVYSTLKKIQTLTKQVGKYEMKYINVESVVTCKGKTNKYKLFYDNKAYQPIPQKIYDKLIGINPELVIHYATLRYAYWYLTFKDEKQQLDIKQYVKIMKLKNVDEFNEIQLNLAKQGILQAELSFKFYDGLNDNMED